jgi:hypothetical protein
MVVPEAFDRLTEEKAMSRSRTAGSAGGPLASAFDLPILMPEPA